MLAELTIENFAIIDRLMVNFEPGFTVLTGETGAGKSIIIDALHAALGARIGSDVVRTGARSAVVEAVFTRNEQEDADVLRPILTEYGIDDEECIILRREVHASGRTSARVNGRAVPQTVLGTLGSLLVDIHGQSDHLAILRRDRQMDVLDRYGGLLTLRREVGAAVKEYTRARRAADELAAGRREAEQRLDLLRFQVQEIESAALQADEEESLAAERLMLVNAERLAQLAADAYQLLQGDAVAALDLLSRAAGLTRDLAGIDPTASGLAERLEGAQFEVEDLAQELRRYRDGMEFDPNRLNAIEDRLDVLARLKRKYGSTVLEILEFGRRARSELEDVENFDERFNDLTRQAEDAEARAGALASELSRHRAEAAVALQSAMQQALGGLGLPSTRFEVELARTLQSDGLSLSGDGERVAYNASGVDGVTFTVSFNPGESVRPLDRVASGGETSRFMLALKSVLAEADQTATLIFDEVDVGVGGRAAADVGERMRQLAHTHQVLSITHLPQIAALADQHLRVSKNVRDGMTGVAVRQLGAGERIAELAEMMTGTGTDVARRNAQELLEAAQQGR